MQPNSISSHKLETSAVPVAAQLSAASSSSSAPLNIKATDTKTILPPRKPTSYWQFTAVCEFFQLFNSNIFNLFLPTLSDKLEKEVLNPTEWFFKVIMKLFKNYYKSRNTRLSVYNLVFYLKKESNIHFQWAMDYMHFLHDDTYRGVTPKMVEDSPIPPAPTPPTFITLLDLSAEHRILSLYFLIELQMDISDWKYLNQTPEEVAMRWRVVPVGYDRWGCSYWLFDDSRLFREASQEVVDQYAPSAGTVASATNSIPSISAGGSAAPTPTLYHPDTFTNGHSVKQETSVMSTASSSESLPPNPNQQPKLKLKLSRPTIKPPTSKWQLVCKTASEWELFPSLFWNATTGFNCADEKVFYEYLTNLLPLVIRDIESSEEEKKKRKKHERDWDNLERETPKQIGVLPSAESSSQFYGGIQRPSATLSEQFQIIGKSDALGATRRKRQLSGDEPVDRKK